MVDEFVSDSMNGLNVGRPCGIRFQLGPQSGDVIVLGGEDRLAFHGIDRILPGTSDLLQEGGRFNLTLRRVTKPA